MRNLLSIFKRPKEEDERPFHLYDPEEFHNTYMLGMLANGAGEDVFFRYLDAKNEGRKLKVYDDEMAIIAAEQEQMEEFNRKIYLAARLNNEGMAMEKTGDIFGAIAKYEENILPEARLSLHPYHRLCVLYRRFGDYENEIRVIETCLARPEWKDERNVQSKELAFFKDRLIKAKSYQSKGSKS